MTAEVVSIAGDNLSSVWARTFLAVVNRGVEEIVPLVVTVTNNSADLTAEQLAIREVLDHHIVALRPKYPKLQPCSTVANTIFPHSMWNPCLKDDAQALFARFNKAWPRIKRCPQNRRGSYFRRLTAYGRDEDHAINQLEHIMNTYRGGNHRRSALQAAIFDPSLDHTNAPLLGFPCLHQIAFTPVGNRGLGITGFYATQYIFDRAYGNYLGLCRLGTFMAKHMGLQLTRMTCIASVGQLGTPNKSDVRPLAVEMEKLIAKDEGGS